MTSAAALTAACSGLSPDRDPAEVTVSTLARVEERPVRVMPLGDSLTEGGDPSQPTTSPQSYRGYLETALRDAGYDVDFVGSLRRPAIAGTDPDHEGHSGFSVGPDDSTLCDGCGPANLDEGLAQWLAAASPDVVLLMVGVNDLLPPERRRQGVRRDTVPEETAGKLRALVGRIRRIAPEAAVVVASYPPISFLTDAGSGVAEAFAALNEAARDLGDGSDPKVHYAPVAESVAELWEAVDVVGDGLHPSASGARRLADVWFEAVTPVLDGVGTPAG